MPKSKAKKDTLPPPNASIKDRVIDASLNVAKTLGWAHANVRDICALANITMAEFYDHFDDKNDVLVAYGRRLDKALIATYQDMIDDGSSPRDRLFDIVMERLDMANKDRASVVSIVESFKLDPKQALITCPHLTRSMALMLELAHVETNGMKGALRVATFTALYLWVLRTWMKDDSADLSPTMAVLDKSLARIDEWAERLAI